jgi:predicted MFS family arabinose efflux permease
MVFVAVSETAMKGIPPQHAGMASGFLMTGHEVGAALGVAALSAVATTAGNLTSPAGVFVGFSCGFVAAAVVAVLVAITALLKMPSTRTTSSAHMHMP